VLCYSKQAAQSDDTVLMVVNLDPHGTRETVVHLTMPALGFDWHETFSVVDEITGESWRWGEHNYVRLDPFREPAPGPTLPPCRTITCLQALPEPCARRR